MTIVKLLMEATLTESGWLNLQVPVFVPRLLNTTEHSTKTGTFDLSGKLEVLISNN